MSTAKYRASALLVGFLSFVLVVMTGLVITGSYELQTRAIFEEGTGGAGGGSSTPQKTAPPASKGGGTQSGGSSGSSGPSAPALPPETCTGTCVVFGCSISGRRSTGGTCNYSRFCCTGNQVVKVCAVEGDICGTSFGTVCCAGLSCSGATSGFCRPGGASEGAIGAVDTACTNAGGQCVNAGSCGAAGLSTMNGGAGCSLGVCCSKANVQTKLECKTDGVQVNVTERGSCCSGTYYQPVSGRYVCGVSPMASQATGGQSSTMCLRDGTTVSSVDLASSCCNGALPATNGVGFVCTTGGIKIPKAPGVDCSPNEARWVPGVTCCSATIYRRDGQEYCGAAPAYIVDISPGQMCQRPNWAPIQGTGRCRCNGRVINWGETCVIDFAGTSNQPGRVRACQNQLPGCWEVYVCDANYKCVWVNQSDWVNNPQIVTEVYIDNLRSAQVVIVENGQTRQIPLSDLSPEEFQRLLKEGKIKNARELYGYTSQVSPEGVRQQILNDPTLSPAEKALLSAAVGSGLNPYELQDAYRKYDLATQGARDWQNRTEALLKDPNLPLGQRLALLAYQAADLATLGGVTSAQEAAYQWALCNAEANAGLRPQGCFLETVNAGIQGTLLGAAPAAKIQEGINLALDAVRGGNVQLAIDRVKSIFGAGVADDIARGNPRFAKLPQSNPNVEVYLDTSTVGTSGSNTVYVLDKRTGQLVKVHNISPKAIVVRASTSTAGTSTTVQGGTTGEFTTIYIIDPANDPTLKAMLQNGIDQVNILGKNPNLSPELNNTVGVMDYVVGEFGQSRPYVVTVSKEGKVVSTQRANYTGDSSAVVEARNKLATENQGVVRLGEACNVSTGVCLEQSLVASSMLDNLGVENSVVWYQKNDLSGSTHALVKVKTPEGVYYMDPSNGWILPEAQAIKELEKVGYTTYVGEIKGPNQKVEITTP